jgi:hypothetical protein
MTKRYQRVILVTPLVYFGHCIVCSLIYIFWLPFGIFWSLSCLFFDLRFLITTLVSFGHCLGCSLTYVFWLPFGICWSLSCLFFDLRLLITTLVSFGHCLVCSLIYVFWLPLWYLLVIVLSVLWFKSSDYPLVSQKNKQNNDKKKPKG